MQRHDDALVVALATTLDMIVFLLRRLLLSQKEVLSLLTLNWSAELYDVLLLQKSDVKSCYNFTRTYAYNNSDEAVTTLRVRTRDKLIKN